MMQLGLQQKFALGLLVSGVVLVSVLAALWQIGTRSNLELVSQTSSVMREQAWLDLQRRGEVTARFLTESLPNPLYYYDLQSIGDAARSALDQRDVRYVLVFDGQGRIVHDGSRDIWRFGETMDDPQAAAAVSAGDTLVQWGDDVLDISMPIFLGRERLGGVRVGLSRTEVEATIARAQAALSERLQVVFLSQLRYLMFGFGLLLVAMAVMGWLVGRGLVKPIRELAAAAHSLERGSYEVTVATRRRDELGALVSAFSKMAESLRDHDLEIRRLAYQDTLTGLPNRLLLRELIDQAIAVHSGAGRRLGLLFIDLDDFKRINDTLGHDVGDEVLIEFSRRLQGCLSAVDDQAGDPASSQVARLGGDEFVALVSGGDIEARSAELAQRVMDALRIPFRVVERSLYLSASIGIAVFPEDAGSSKLLLKCGDLAMYQAKQQGKNCFGFFNDRMVADADQRLALEQDLRDALKNGEMSVVYEPIIALGDGRLAAVEALLRWQHPRRGHVEPGLFIAVAEGSNLIEELGAFVLDQACHHAALWQREVPGLQITVNISARQIKPDGLLELVDRALADSELPGSCLNLELTEGSLLNDRELASDALAQVRARGVKVWLDDFGSGFTGLTHLRRVQVDGVKIDRNFIADMSDNDDDLALTAAIITTAHSLGMQVVAEGVENESQRRTLAAYGCDLAQGNWFGVAVPAADFMQRYQPVGLERS